MLWIITQDKKVLVNVKEVTVKGNFIEGVVNRSFFVYWSKVLGKYDTNDRAKEVVEEIYSKIEQGNSSIITFSMPAK
ncbi:hypothetical protein [Halalkalibacter alkalisediminis]|uniref:Uncharacterized protein n=1 Tax=Halalkalibacter alkalisediminis TaxID=935616 RepID=A0ABV6NL14_9BACI|nr:hypothetical protein [Halalkalibacter alkalisediminis]